MLLACLIFALQDILENDDLPLDDMFIASIVFDLIKVRRKKITKVEPCINRNTTPELDTFKKNKTYYWVICTHKPFFCYLLFADTSYHFEALSVDF